ncbi:MAG: PilZ domain-containing protein [Syntrophaceae bacterium]|nr:PilZ domain-containing protein [Syntrophaceae bacterium]
MKEKRRTPRIDEENEVTITVVSEEHTLYNLPKKKLIGNYTKNVSEGGAKIQTYIYLPIDTLIKMEFLSEGIKQQINAIGKVKWIKIIVEGWSYDAGVEFCGTPNEAIKKLGDYISKKLKSQGHNPA